MDGCTGLDLSTLGTDANCGNPLLDRNRQNDSQGNGVHAYGKFTDTWSVDSGAELKVKVDWTAKGAWYLGRITEGRVTVRERCLVTGPISSALTTYTGEADLRNEP